MEGASRDMGREPEESEFWKPREAQILRGGGNGMRLMNSALDKSCFSEEVRCETLISLKSRERRRQNRGSKYRQGNGVRPGERCGVMRGGF